MGSARSTSTARKGDRSTRRYDSPLRAERTAATKQALVAAATERFISRGWANTGMRDVARDAGVAVETLYSHYPSKRKLLDAVVGEAAVGDDEPIPVAERPEFQALGRGSRAARIAAAASITAGIHRRTAPFARLIREAASTDDALAEVRRDSLERQRVDVAAGLALILGRPATEAERDGTWAILNSEVYLLLVEQAGWTDEQYERWLSETLGRVIPRA